MQIGRLSGLDISIAEESQEPYSLGYQERFVWTHCHLYPVVGKQIQSQQFLCQSLHPKGYSQVLDLYVNIHGNEGNEGRGVSV